MLNHHAIGFDYLNLHRSDGLTAKVYISDPVRLKTCGNQDYLVNPHNHGYNFESYVIYGEVDNILFTPRKNSLGPYRMYEFDWRTKGFELQDGQFSLSSVRKVYTPGQSYYMTHDQIHTISIAERQPTCLFLVQFADQDKLTNLFTREPPDCENGLYVKPTLDQTKELIDKARFFMRNNNAV